jgi:hypothetical protein
VEAVQVQDAAGDVSRVDFAIVTTYRQTRSYQVIVQCAPELRGQVHRPAAKTLGVPMKVYKDTLSYVRSSNGTMNSPAFRAAIH